MKPKYFFFRLFLFACVTSSAQVQFVSGYFISNDGQKIDCQIKNEDWRDNPSSFEYKLSENSQIEIGAISTVKEFGILNNIKYERYSVKIDKSSDRISELTSSKTPKFIEEILFLKVMVEGEANLYRYNKKNFKRFFFKIKNEPVLPLIYKKYRIGSKIGANERFKQQLISALVCGNTSNSIAESVSYKDGDLERYFIAYNDECGSTESKIYNEENGNKKSELNLSVKVGVTNSKFSIERNLSFPTSNITSNYSVDFGKKINPRFGLELELILPIDNNKWAIFIDPSYQRYSSKTDGIGILTTVEYETKANVYYNTVELPFGFRYYLYLSKKSRLFANASIAMVFNSDSKIEYTKAPSISKFNELEINGTEEYFSLGVGYSFIDKFSFEFRYNTKRDLLGDNPDWTSNYDNNFSLILGYSIF